MKKNKEEIIKIVEDYEQKLRNLGPLITKEDLNLSKKSIQEFLLDFFYYNHMSRNESSVKNPIFTGTYIPDKNGKYISGSGYQCSPGRRRSIGDLFQLALGLYSTDITLMEVMESAMNIVDNIVPIKSKDGRYTYYMYVTTCSTIHRRVFNVSSGKNLGFNINNADYSTETTINHDEFPIKLEDYITLANTGSFVSYRSQKESERNNKPASSKSSKKELDDIDKLIAKKIAKLLEDSSDKVSLVKKSPLKKKRVLV